MYAPDPSLENRLKARDELKATPGTNALFEQERDKLAGEGEEPEWCI